MSHSDKIPDNNVQNTRAGTQPIARSKMRGAVRVSGPNSTMLILTDPHTSCS